MVAAAEKGVSFSHSFWDIVLLQNQDFLFLYSFH